VSPEPVPIRPAATVLLLRDGDGGLEVFMLRRNREATFVGGVYVFPGGKVDPSDRGDPGLEEVCSGRDDASCSSALGVGSGGLAYWVAAIRECFEEAGVLLATEGDSLVSLTDPGRAERFARYRESVYSGDLRLAELCRREGLRLAVDRVGYLSHWITPVGPPRRFDTRFFVAAAPPDQVPLHDGGETVASEWIGPGEALRRHRAGEFDLILPTIRNLEDVARFGTVEEVMADVGARRDIAAITPRIVRDESGIRVIEPGRPGYDEALDRAPTEGTITGVPRPRPE